MAVEFTRKGGSQKSRIALMDGQTRIIFKRNRSSLKQDINF